MNIGGESPSCEDQGPRSEISDHTAVCDGARKNIPRGAHTEFDTTRHLLRAHAVGMHRRLEGIG